MIEPPLVGRGRVGMDPAEQRTCMKDDGEALPASLVLVAGTYVLHDGPGT